MIWKPFFDKGQARKLSSNGVICTFTNVIELWTAGKIDHNRTGMEQTNRKGTSCLQNWNTLTVGLMGFYPVDNVIHD